jgi:hypothetical protein
VVVIGFGVDADDEAWTARLRCGGGYAASSELHGKERESTEWARLQGRERSRGLIGFYRERGRGIEGRNNR